MSNADQADPAPKAAEAPAPRLLSHMATLPEEVKQRVTTLQEIQKQHDEIEAEFHKERAALIAKYQKLYGPFYEKRAGIINGDGETLAAEGNEAPSKGVPEFWLTAMKANDVVGIQITDKDQGALKYLKDIKSFYLDEPKGFRLEFYFAENPYFTNTVLTKEYHMMDEDEPILERAIASKIDWKPGKNLTVKLMKKKPKKGAPKDEVVQTKLQECDSFFNFFNPPKIPGDEEDIDIDEAEELQDLMEQDYDVGATIRDKIIPHAVSWYTGEALQGELDEDESGEDDEDEEDEEDDEDDDDDEYEEDDESESDATKKDEAPTCVKTEEAAQK